MPQPIDLLMPEVGLEPTRSMAPRDFKSLASTSSATQAQPLIDVTASREPRMIRRQSHRGARAGFDFPGGIIANPLCSVNIDALSDGRCQDMMNRALAIDQSPPLDRHVNCLTLAAEIGS